MLTEQQLRNLVRLVDERRETLELLVRLTKNEIDDWLLKILLRLVDFPEHLESVLSWLKFVRLVRGEGVASVVDPVLPAAFSDLEIELHQFQCRLLELDELGS